MTMIDFALVALVIVFFIFIFSRKKDVEDDDSNDPKHVFSVEKFNNEYFVYNELKHSLFVTQQITLEDVIEYVTKNHSGLISIVTKEADITDELVDLANKKNLVSHKNW